MRRLSLWGAALCVLMNSMVWVPAALGQEGAYPKDNDEDYYYNTYTPEKAPQEVKQAYPADNDEDYYQQYYYDYYAKQGKKQQYYPEDDAEKQHEPYKGYQDYYRGTAPSNTGNYYEKTYPEDNDATYYKDVPPMSAVNQYD